MVIYFFHHWILRGVIIFSLSYFTSCNGPTNKVDLEPIHKELSHISYYHLPASSLDKDVFYNDTVTVQNSGELIKQISNNRLIKLVNTDYYFKSTLHLDSIHNLKIVGADSSKLMIEEKNATVLKLTNAYNIHLDQLIIGHTENRRHKGEQGALVINHSYQVNISNCKVLGSGTFGLKTYDVQSLKFTNSEITVCTILIFELEKSRKIEFQDSKFYNNHLATSVLGGFTSSTKEVTFLNCEFSNNKPDMIGNPAFNFMDNLDADDEQIIFTNCTFKKNKGFKWYGDKIELKDCAIDSTDFINFQKEKE